MRLFERDLLLVADQPAQEVGGEGAAGEELGVRAAVRNAGKVNGESLKISAI